MERRVRSIHLLVRGNMEDIRVRTMLQDRHLPKFQALPPDVAALVCQRLIANGGLPVHQPTVHSGDELFEVCRERGLDHAGVVLSLARETSHQGLRAIETLVGRPISPWASSTADKAAAATPKPRGVAAPRVHETDPMVVVFVPSNPKRPGTEGWRRFELWKIGYTVAELKAEGLWPADVKWELERDTVKLAPPGSPEALEAIAKRPAAA